MRHWAFAALLLPTALSAANRVSLELPSVVGHAPAPSPPLYSGAGIVSPTLQGVLAAYPAEFRLASTALTPAPGLVAAAISPRAAPVTAASAVAREPSPDSTTPRQEKAIDQLRREAAEAPASLPAELPGLDPDWGLEVRDMVWATAFEATDRRGATVFLKFRDERKAWDDKLDIKQEAAVTERIRGEFFDPARASAAPIDPLAMLPRVRGIGPFSGLFARSVSWSSRLRETGAPAELRGGKTVMAVEGLPGRDLNSLYPYNESSARMSARQWRALESIVARMHALGYAHGDIAAPNVLIEQSRPGREGRVALIDFEATVRRGEIPDEAFAARAARDLAALRTLKKEIRKLLAPR